MRQTRVVLCTTASQTKEKRDWGGDKKFSREIGRGGLGGARKKRSGERGGGGRGGGGGSFGVKRGGTLGGFG